MSRFSRRTIIIAAFSLALMGTAFAQTQQNGAQHGASGCVSNGSGSGSLSNKLSQSNGVICPPDVDQGMKAPTPNSGKMPVIPPPGSPGGDPELQPK